MGLFGVPEMHLIRRIISNKNASCQSQVRKKEEEMGEIADDMVNGACCSHCGVYFTEEHGYPVLCHSCYDSETPEERAGIQRSLYED